MSFVLTLLSFIGFKLPLPPNYPYSASQETDTYIHTYIVHASHKHKHKQTDLFFTDVLNPHSEYNPNGI